MTTLAIHARGVTKAYGDVQALAGVDLDVAHGECVALLGPNGAGKTTTTEILEGFRKRDTGTVSVLGIDPSHATLQWKARLGIVLQTAADLKELTVVESVAHFSKYFRQPADVDAVIAAVGLESKRKAKVGNLSGGQRRRLDVALGVIGTPELLFLDEPTTGFDPEARRQFWTLIEDLKANGVTILLTTHYLDEAERLADRVAIVAAGRVVADDSPSRLRAEAARFSTVTWTEDGRSRSQQTETPTAFVRDLLARHSGEIQDFAVTHPSLEDAYLKLTGAEAEVGA